MRSVVSWSEQVPDRDGQPTPIFDLAFKPDGSQLVAAVGNRVVVYDVSDADVVQQLKAHTDTVYCVAWSADGKRFATGGADKTVYIWTASFEGILKFTHTESIQALAFNPVNGQLCSVAASDFGTWAQDQKSVSKQKLPSRGLCCSWSCDGQILAIGMYNGMVSLRDRAGDEKFRIQRNSPIWSLAFGPSSGDTGDLLAVGCWDQTLSMFTSNGRQVGLDSALGFDPCSVSWFGSDFLIVAGADNRATMYTKEGVQLGLISERDDWVWCARARPKHNYVAVGTNSGTIVLHQIVFGTVHGLYQDRYAVREQMTDIVLQNLSTDKRLRIKCNAWVKKIAIFRDRLAVQLPEAIAIYELYDDDVGGGGAGELHCRVIERIQRKVECNLLVVTHNNVILCLERKLQLLAFNGDREREWTLDSSIRYIKVVGGPPGREGLLVGLKSGAVLKLFVDNPFPITLIQHKSAIRCLDLSATREMLAVVDEGSNVVVYSIASREVLMTEAGANSVAFNTELSDMVCWSGNGSLHIKAGSFPSHQQRMQGFVVGFKGAKVFCLHYLSMTTVDVPQSATLYRFLDKKDLDGAYRVACLGVTDADWRALGNAALGTFRLDIARRAFVRVRDMRYLDLIAQAEAERDATGRIDEVQFHALLAAFQGKFVDAAKTFSKGKSLSAAIDMFSDMKMWQDAREWARTNGVEGTDLFKRQAESALDSGDFREAAELFSLAGDRLRAVRIAADNHFDDLVVEIVRASSKHDTQTLAKCAAYLKSSGNKEAAAEAFMKMGDMEGLLTLYVESQQWDDAFRIARTNPPLEPIVYLPYAAWLAEQGLFDEALDAFAKAGRPDQALSVLRQLSQNAIHESRFDDAGYYLFRLSVSHLSSITAKTSADVTASDRIHLEQAEECRKRAEVYYAYAGIYQFTQDPFTPLPAETLFNMACFLLAKLSADSSAVPGVSRKHIVYTLAKFASSLGAFKLARAAYDRLQHLRLPAEWQEHVDVASLNLRAQPFRDRDDMNVTCCCCSFLNPLSIDRADECVNCLHGFVRSFVSFDVLPLVEFSLDDGIDDAEAARLISTPPAMRVRRSGGGASKIDASGPVQTMTFGDFDDDDDVGGGAAEDDPFAPQLDAIDRTQAFVALLADRHILQRLQPEEVFIVPASHASARCRYFRNCIADVPIVLCGQCQHFFQQEDYEFAVLKGVGCPFCKFKGDAIRACAPSN